MTNASKTHNSKLLNKLVRKLKANINKRTMLKYRDIADESWIYMHESAKSTLDRIFSGQIINVASIGTTCNGQYFLVETDRNKTFSIHI